MVPGLVMVCLALLPGLAHALSISIATLDDLNKIGRDPAYPLDGIYVLTADIDASATQGWNGGAGFKPIGAYATPFTGIFNGQGHVIRNLYINRPDADYVGLFGYTGSAAEIRNLGLEGGSVTGRTYAGGLVGYNGGGTLTSCYASGSIMASGDYALAGGLVGENYNGTLTSCYATGAVTATATGGYRPPLAGGLVGYNDGGTLTSCYATGMVAGDYVTGGLVGYNDGGTLTSCYWDVDTTGQSVGVGHVYGGGTAGGTGLATTQMKQQASFAGWDFTSVWTIQENQTYPYFHWQAALGHVPVPTIPPDTTEEDARNTLAAAGFVPGTLLERWSDTVPAGQVIGTIPAGGTVTAPGGVVDLVISRGPKPVIAIASLDDLNKIGRDPAYPRDVHYVLTADIDASATQGWNGGAGFEPIGPVASPFTGTFDGQGHVIRNLYINRPDANYVGLFGVTGGAAEIRNLGLEGGSVTGRTYAGGLVGLNSGTLTSCYATGAVTVTATATSEYDASAGGLVGRNSGTLTSCYATGAVTATATGGYRPPLAGGLVGGNSGTLTSCYATGTVTATTTGSFGNAYAGGLVGDNDGTLTSCYATGAVSAGSTYDDAYAGGLVGWNYGTLTSCYATGMVAGDYVTGGLVGWNYGTLTSCYATGMVAGDYVTGGLVGYNDGGTLTSCYWDVDTTGQSVGVGHVYGGGTAGGTGLATTQMKQQASFAGWDFTTHWTIQEGQTYPYFPWQAALGHVPVPTIPPGTTEEDARNTLAAAGFVPGTLLERWSDTVPAGQVVDTVPAGGTVTAPGGEVDLVISRGPKPVIAIASLGDLNRIGRDPAYPRDVHYVLTADIDASTTQGWNGGAGFEPIGTWETPFTGTFDGQGHVIRNLYINRPDADYVGLFGVTGGAAEIRNLGLEGGSIMGGNEVGGLVGANTGTLTSCYATGSVTATVTGGYSSALAGGLVGYNLGSLTSCYATGSVTATAGEDRSANAGGLVGWNYGTLTSCYATGAVSASGDYASAGGLVGYNDGGTLTSCYATGAVTATATGGYSSASAGGLVGWNYGTLTSCYATGAVSATSEYSDAYAGGLVGVNYHGTLTSCYATGSVMATVTGEYSYADAGGLVGSNDAGSLTSCYATGAVTATATGDDSEARAGGLVGYNDGGTLTSCYATGSVMATVTGEYSYADAGGLVGSNDAGSLTSCYATGSVSASGNYAYAGGLVGYNDGGTLTSCYWDVDTTGQSVGVGHVYGGGTAGGTGLTTAQMKQQASFAGWDFTSVWTIQEGQTYPYLRWQDNTASEVTVPNVVGQTQADATTAITNAGLTVGTVTTQCSDTVAAGNVISQNLAAGASVAPGTVVNLVVSTGPCGGQQVTVPNVVGQAQADATTALTNAGLTVGTVIQQCSDTVATGNVISQDPAAGVEVSPGTSVNLVVSTGPCGGQQVTVPNVVGQAQATATTAITNAGLTVGTVTRAYSATVAAGVVISQDPAAGSTVSGGAAVNLVVSLGAPTPGNEPTRREIMTRVYDRFEDLDTNNDGTLSLAEAMAGVSTLPAEVFQAIDANGDNQLSQDELRDYLNIGGVFGCVRRLFVKDLLVSAGGDLLLAGLGLALLAASVSRRRS